MSYIVIEGIDRSGKTNLSVRLRHLLNGRLVAEPFAETEAALKAKEIMTNNELPQHYQIGMFLAQRIDLFKRVVSGYLAHSRDVISDRSFITSMVYQADKDYSMGEIMDINTLTAKGMGYDLFPDVLIYLDLDHATYMSRLSEGEVYDKEIRLIDKNYFEKIREDYITAIDMVVEKAKELGKEIKVIKLPVSTKFHDPAAVLEMIK